MFQYVFSKFVIFFGPGILGGKEASFQPWQIFNREQKDFQHLVFKNILLPFQKAGVVLGVGSVETQNLINSVIVH